MGSGVDGEDTPKSKVTISRGRACLRESTYFCRLT